MLVESLTRRRERIWDRHIVTTCWDWRDRHIVIVCLDLRIYWTLIILIIQISRYWSLKENSENSGIETETSRPNSERKCWIQWTLAWSHYGTWYWKGYWTCYCFWILQIPLDKCHVSWFKDRVNKDWRYRRYLQRLLLETLEDAYEVIVFWLQLFAYNLHLTISPSLIPSIDALLRLWFIVYYVYR